MYLKIEFMSNIFKALSIIMVMAATVTVAHGQKKLDREAIADLQKTPKYAFVLTTERHFKGVLNMYDLLIENGVLIEDYEIVVKGKVVTQLVKNSELEAFFKKYKGKVKVSVCSVAMEKLGVAEETLFDGLNVTPTASVRMLQLQANGYNTLTY
jgi:intracellular sulfur oxidation DsrE/DsrF family protein